MFLKHSPVDIRLRCITEELNFPPLDTVRLAIFGLPAGREDTLVLKKESQFTWKQPETASPCEM